MAGDLQRALEAEYERRREACRAEEARRAAQAARECPEIAQLAEERQRMVFSGVQGILQGSASAEELPRRMAQINSRIGELLRAGGHPEDWLDPVCVCAKCRDTGFTGELIREECACRAALKAKLRAESMGGACWTADFGHYDLEVFPDEKPLAEAPWSQRRQMEMVSGRLRAWSQACPDNERRTLLLLGKSGLGKTWLLSCMANELIRRGVPCLTTSAYAVVEAARRAAFSGDGEDWDAALTTRVVMVDDLGSEPLYQNVTVEQLYQFVEQRRKAGLTTVFSSNLTEAELQRRYTERIASRLTDKRESEVIVLYGEDIRRR